MDLLQCTVWLWVHQWLAETELWSTACLKRCSHCAQHCTIFARCHTTPCDNWRRNWTWFNFSRNWTKFNFCVSVVAAKYDVVLYVNSTVKSMCSITATSDDIVRHRPVSYDVVRSVNSTVKSMCSITATSDDIVRHRPVSYDVVRYVNSTVKSMCSITATSDDVVRHRPVSYDVVRSVNTALVI